MKQRKIYCIEREETFPNGESFCALWGNFEDKESAMKACRQHKKFINGLKPAFVTYGKIRVVELVDKETR